MVTGKILLKNRPLKLVNTINMHKFYLDRVQNMFLNVLGTSACQGGLGNCIKFVTRRHIVLEVFLMQYC